MEGISGEILNNRQVCDEYSYDGCGALTKDKNKGIYQITYDFNGMPTCVWFDNGSITDYVYTFDGVKLKTVHRTAVDGTTASGSTPQLSEQNTLSKDSTLYVGAMEVRNGRIERYHFSNGYMDISQGQLSSYNYYAKDYLGNVRHVERTAPGTNNQIVQVVNYYPFGGLLNDGPSSLDVQNKLYNGKELDRMHGLNWYDYGARQYDAAICQFTTMDPLCEKYYNMSPYAYCAANPVRFVDIDGREMGLPEELLFAVKHPFITSRIGVGVTKGAINISTNATRFATRGNILYGSNPKAGQDDRGSENGAFRHALWQAEITSEFGSNIAKQVGDAHEDNPNIDMNKTVFSSIDEADKSVDLHNNIIGRIIGDKNKGAGMRDIAVAVLNAFKEDGLYVANKVKGEYVLEKVKINSDKHKQLLNIFNKLDNNGRFDYEKPQIEDDEIRRYEALQNALP